MPSDLSVLDFLWHTSERLGRDPKQSLDNLASIIRDLVKLMSGTQCFLGKLPLRSHSLTPRFFELIPHCFGHANSDRLLFCREAFHGRIDEICNGHSRVEVWPPPWLLVVQLS